MGLSSSTPSTITLIQARSLRESADKAKATDLIKQVFKRCDLDGNGTLELTEFIKVAQLIEPQVSEETAKKLFKHCDRNRSSSIDIEEFLAWVLEESVRWKVVGPTEGLLIREAAPAESDFFPHRLAQDAVVEEIVREGKSLKFRLLEGDGPETGWVHMETLGTEVLVKLDCDKRSKKSSGKTAKHTKTDDSGKTAKHTGTDGETEEKPESCDGSPQLQEYYEECRRNIIRALEHAHEDPFVTLSEFSHVQDRRHFDRILAPLIERAFNYYDANKDGVIDSVESSRLFENLVSQNSNFHKFALISFTRQSLERAITPLEEQIRELGGSKAVQAHKKAQQDLKRFLEDVICIVETILEGVQQDYSRNKKTRDAAAFRLLDVDHDGRLQKSEVLAAFTPKSEKMQRFMAAFGFDEEVLKEKFDTAIAKIT